MELVRELQENNLVVRGYCFYHTQDLERAVDPEIRNLYLGFDSPTQDDDEAVEVGKLICETLRKNGFEYEWNETIDQRIQIKNLNWQKVPSDDDFGAIRNIRIFDSYR